MNSTISLIHAHALYLAEQLELAILAEAKRRVEEDARLAAFAYQIALKQVQEEEILASEEIY